MSLPDMRKRFLADRHLTDDQRDTLAQLVIDHIGMTKAISEAAKEWTLADWKRVLHHAKFREVCKEKALAESNGDLMAEARKYAGDEKVEEVVS